MWNKWDYAYLDIAKRFSLLSSANRLKVGAIAVKDRRVIGLAYNGTPAGWDNVCENEHGETKPEVIHAEANLIGRLARCGDSSVGSAIYITHSPCLECSKQIFAAGIHRVYYDMLYSSSISATSGLEFLKKCGVNVYGGELPDGN